MGDSVMGWAFFYWCDFVLFLLRSLRFSFTFIPTFFAFTIHTTIRCCSFCICSFHSFTLLSISHSPYTHILLFYLHIPFLFHSWSTIRSRSTTDFRSHSIILFVVLFFIPHSFTFIHSFSVPHCIPRCCSVRCCYKFLFHISFVVFTFLTSCSPAFAFVYLRFVRS